MGAYRGRENLGEVEGESHDQNIVNEKKNPKQNIVNEFFQSEMEKKDTVEENGLSSQIA